MTLINKRSALLLSPLFSSLVCANIWAAPPERFQQMTHTERLKALYEPTPSFTERGEPVLSVGLTWSQPSLTLSRLKGLQVYLGADPLNALTLPKDVTRLVLEQVKLTTPQEVERWEALAERTTTEVTTLDDLEAQWRSRGLKDLARFTTGAYLPGGPQGQPAPLDARSITLAYRPSQALKNNEHLKRHQGRRFKTLKRPARGVIKLSFYRKRDKDPHLSLITRDLAWISVDEGSVTRVSAPQGKHGRRSYQGELYVTVGDQGLSLAHVLPLERLVEGVVPSELYRSAPLEALKAQAIAARSHALVKLGTRHLTHPFMLCASTHCQAYKGVDYHHKNTSAATQATRGLVAVRADGHPLDTVYSSTCGGHTESYHEVWGGEERPHLIGREDNASGTTQAITPQALPAFLKVPVASFCQEPTRTFRWRVRRKLSDIQARLERSEHLTQPIGALKGVEVTRRGVSGRAQEVRYLGAQGSVVVRGDYANRSLLKLKSGLWISEALEGGVLRFEGAGFGHGVGMCQHGAMGMAKAGASVNDILEHYYAGAGVAPLW